MLFRSDDESIILDGMRALLEHWGYRVHTAQTIESARGILEQHAIRIVFADYQLKQDITGLDLLREIISHTPNMRVSLLTAEATPDLSNRAAESGIMVLRKPADPNEIRQFLIEAYDRKAPYAAE